MEEIYKSTYWVLTYDKERSIIIGTWLATSEDMTEEDIYHNFNAVTDIVKEYKPKFYLADDRERLYVYNLELQTWVADIITETFIEAALEKFAVLLPKDLITGLSTDQTVDALELPPFQTQVLETPEEAMAWFGV